MNLALIVQRIESIITMLLRRDPQFSGNLTLNIYFREGQIRDIERIERQKEKVKG